MIGFLAVAFLIVAVIFFLGAVVLVNPPLEPDRSARAGLLFVALALLMEAWPH